MMDKMKTTLAPGGLGRIAHLVLVRIMRRLAFFLIIALLAVARSTHANAAVEFRAASADAAKKFHPGYQYIIKFEDWISNAAVDALNACGSYPNTNLTCDIVFVVEADGHIRRTVFGPKNAYRDCVAKQFHTSGLAPKPPGNSWPVQIRLIDGRRPIPKESDPPFLIFSSYKP
jgi:hypothetical protein